MTRIEKVDREDWKEFLDAPIAVLMLSKRDCHACEAWTEKLERFLAEDTEWSDVRFGKMLLDVPGLGEFKRASPCLAEVDVLPHNVIYQDGKKQAEFAGGGLARLFARLQRLVPRDAR